MHIPSDSWGQFVKCYLQKDNDDVTELSFHDLISNDYILSPTEFRKSAIINKAELLKNILEGIQMPIANPFNEGEMDTVDLSRVSKIVIDSEKLIDMKANESIRLDMSFVGYPEEEYLTLHAKNAQKNIDGELNIALPLFEGILSQVVHHSKDKRLESNTEYKKLNNQILRSIVEDYEKKDILYAIPDEKVILNNGIGIITDMKTNQTVGTFEAMEYFYFGDNQKDIVTFKQLILASRTFEELAEAERHQFEYFSLADNRIYRYTLSSHSKAEPGNSSINITGSAFNHEKLDPSYPSYTLAEQAQKNKSLMEGLTEGDPLYASAYAELRESRMAIVEESKQKQDEEKLVSQFADLDFDF